MSEEKRLARDLHIKYEQMGLSGRPVLNISHPVKAKFALGLIKMELREKENVLILSTWARYVSQWKTLHTHISETGCQDLREYHSFLGWDTSQKSEDDLCFLWKTCPAARQIHPKFFSFLLKWIFEHSCAQYPFTNALFLRKHWSIFFPWQCNKIWNMG